MVLLIDIVSGIFIFIGCLFVFGGAFGLIRMPDFYTRLHAASVTDTGGVLFICIGLVLQAIFIFDNPMAAIKIVLTVIFLFFTAPTASHAVAKAALMANIIPQCQNGQSVVDESLASTYKGQDLASVLTNHQSDNTAPQDTDELGNKSKSL
ncbi:MAG: multicomponent Na+:H+ antiporter subunit G [Pseudohongiellaceae bacterium]